MDAPIPGRTYDVSTFTGTPVGALGLQAVTLLDPTWPQGRSVTGIEKLAQRVLMEFLTDYGSMPYQPTRGCGFMAAFRQGLLNTQVAVFQQFAFAANQILRTLGLDALSTDPSDEVLAELSLDSVLFGPGQLAISFTLTSAAGISASLILPIDSEP